METTAIALDSFQASHLTATDDRKEHEIIRIKAHDDDRKQTRRRDRGWAANSCGVGLNQPGDSEDERGRCREIEALTGQ
jgi:hypothetical protein